MYMVEFITNVNSAVNGFVWGVPMLVLLVGTGILMTILTKFFQLSQYRTLVQKYSRRHLSRQACNETYGGRRSVHFPVPVAVHGVSCHHRYR